MYTNPSKQSRELFRIEVPDQTISLTRDADVRPAILLSCGYPDAINLLEHFSIWKENISKDILSHTLEYDFWLIHLTISLHVKPGFYVESLEFGLEIETANFIPPTGVVLNKNLAVGTVFTPQKGERPIVYDLYPRKVIEEVKVQEKLSISPSFEFEKVKMSIGQAESVIEYTEPHPRITAFGKRESKAYWLLEPGVNDGVETGSKDFVLIVRAQKRMPIHARLWVSGKGSGFIFPKNIDYKYQPDFYF